MKKRLRKKLHRGEFQEFGFSLRADYEAFADYGEPLNDFVDALIDAVEKFGGEVGGGFDLAECDLFVTAGFKEGAAERRAGMIEAIKALSGVKKVEAGELVDAWYGNFD